MNHPKTMERESSQNSLRQAILKMAAIKKEHRPILEQISQDPHMLPETRHTLTLHVLEEEEEQVAKIESLLERPTQSFGTKSAIQPHAQSIHPQLTVGSLRQLSLEKS